MKSNEAMDYLKEKQKWAKENKGKFEIGDVVFLKKDPENGIGIIDAKQLSDRGCFDDGFNYWYRIKWLYVGNGHEYFEESKMESVERYRSYLEDYHESCKKAISNLTEDLKEL